MLKTGDGWRIGWDAQADLFKGLVGTDDWALELTEAEMQDFCRLAGQLTETMCQMQGELMPEEKIACNMESDLVWLEAEGYPDAYDLHLIVLTGRRGEGHWAAPSIPHLMHAIQTLKVF
jgi:hypothetical protein